MTGLEVIPPQVLDNFLNSTKNTVSEKLQEKKKEFTLRFSNIGHPCVRKLYLEKNYPEEEIPFDPATLLKFQFGDLTEEYLLFLAELAGHTVEGRQDEVEIAGIKGHRDAVIDGMLFDVKSASSYSFLKFKEGLTKETDSFGYIPQLLSYLEAGQDDPLITEKNKAGFLVFDKQHGKICIDIHHRDPDYDWEAFFEHRKSVVNGDKLPERAFNTEKDGYKHKEKGFLPNGNEYLGVNCSYCSMRNKCWGNIRTFLYANNRPRHFVKIVKEPKVPEIKEFNAEEEEDI